MDAPGLAPGTHLGPYVIERIVGRGGMGEVYLARDSRLNRKVAVKVVPPVFGFDRARLDRFTREARILGALNHPHICVIHDVGSAAGTDFLVMEYVEGESLADRLARGALPVAEALRYAAQIADALARAHACGVIHRDLKPANVIIARTGVKLLDFGLARVEQVDAASLTRMSDSADRLRTMEGAILGTPQYMSPEQAVGKTVDARADIWAFGCVLYEMLTGRRAFDADSPAGVIAAVLNREPLPIPDGTAKLREVQQVIGRCLAKDPEARWQSAADLQYALEWMTPSTSAAADPQRGSWTTPAFRIAWMAVPALAAVIGLVLIASRLPLRASARSMRFTVTAPEAAGVPFEMALSPDGRTLAYSGFHEESDKNLIWLRSLDSLESWPLKGTDGSRQQPFWSPDGSSLGFFSEGRLMRVDVHTGAVQTICRAPGGRGGAWSADGTIVFASTPSAPLSSVDANGGTPVALTTLAAGDSSHRLPSFAADGVHYVFTVLRNDGPPSIRLGRLGESSTREIMRLDATRTGPTDVTQASLQNGYLLYVRGGDLLAAPFDLRAERVSGEPVALAHGVGIDELGQQAFTASEDVLIYRQGAENDVFRQLQWVGRHGADATAVWQPALFDDVSMSPDGTRAAVSITRGGAVAGDVWVIDLTRGAASQLTHSGLADSPLWSKDATMLIYSVFRGLTVKDISSSPADGAGPERVIVDSPKIQKAAVGWSSTGRLLFSGAATAAGGGELWSFDPATKQSNVLLRQSTGEPLLDASVSPDGTLISYSASSGSAREVYVWPLAGGPRVQISSAGGSHPAWRGDGQELFFIAGGKLMAARLHSFRGRVDLGDTEALFDLPAGTTHYKVRPDGERFLLVVPTGRRDTQLPTALTNWRVLAGK